MARALGSKYVIEDTPLGVGAMGSVYRGFDRTGRTFAFKLLNESVAADPRIIAKFMTERAILRSFTDPSLVRVHDFVAESDTLAIVMDLVEGPNLRTWFEASIERSGSPLPPDEVARIGAAIATGLAVVHRSGVVHRDVKPENVLADTTTTPFTPKLTDFGIASIVDNEVVRSTVLSGTPCYVAPELFTDDQVTSAADLYSLGVVLYELACGVPPFMGSLASVMRAHLDARPARPRGIPDELWALIESMLAKSPSQRPTATEVAQRLPRLRLAGLPAAPLRNAPPAADEEQYDAANSHLSDPNLWAKVPVRDVPPPPPAHDKVPSVPVFGQPMPSRPKLNVTRNRVLIAAGSALTLLIACGTGAAIVLSNGEPENVAKGKTPVPTMSECAFGSGAAGPELVAPQEPVAGGVSISDAPAQLSGQDCASPHSLMWNSGDAPSSTVTYAVPQGYNFSAVDSDMGFLDGTSATSTCQVFVWFDNATSAARGYTIEPGEKRIQYSDLMQPSGQDATTFTYDFSRCEDQGTVVIATPRYWKRTLATPTPSGTSS